MTRDNVKKFERKITAAIKKHLAAGGKLKYGSFGNINSNECCPITCLINYKFEYFNDWCDAVASVTNLPFSDKDLWRFVGGFDGSSKKNESRSELYLLGRKLRARFLPIKEYV